MLKLAFVFPGQGAQFVGMSQTFYQKYAIARQTFEEANDTLGFDLAKLCFEGSLLDLNKLEYMFPALLVSSVVSFRVYMHDFGITPQFCAGHSLGEYSALVCAGAINFTDALKIVHKRGLISKEVAESGIGAMTIIDGIDKNIVEEECKKISLPNREVAVSCFNSPTQTAISGHFDAVRDAEDKIMQLGGQISPLLDSAPFHCSAMHSAAENLKEVLLGYSYNYIRYPVISNVTGVPYESSESIIDMLTNQLVKPVQWQTTLNYMQKKGVNLVIEMGPRNVLTNMVKANTQGVDSLCFGQKEDRLLLEDMILNNEHMKKHIPTVITKCLAAVVATPNANWDEDEYREGVILPYKKIQAIEDRLKENNASPSVEDMEEALCCLQTVFNTKKVPLQEQIEWFNQIFDETGTNYLFSGFKMPKA